MALEPSLHRLERVKTYLLIETWWLVVTRRWALIACPLPLQQQVVCVHLAHLNLLEARTQPCIFLRVVLREIIALVLFRVIDPKGLLVEHFNWPMKAQLAVVEPHRIARPAL